MDIYPFYNIWGNSLICQWSHNSVLNEYRGTWICYSLSFPCLMHFIMQCYVCFGHCMILAWHMDTIQRPLAAHCFTKHQTICFHCSWNSVLKLKKNVRFRDSGHLQMQSLRLEKSTKIDNPTINPSLPCLLNQVPQLHISTFLDHLHHLTGQPVPMHYQFFRGETFVHIQPEPPLAQPEVIIPCQFHISCSFMHIPLNWF